MFTMRQSKWSDNSLFVSISIASANFKTPSRLRFLLTEKTEKGNRILNSVLGSVNCFMRIHLHYSVYPLS